MRWIWDLCIANMKQRGIRTGLTVLGVVIGIISIVSLLGIGIGVKRELLDAAAAEGNVTEITIYGTTGESRKDKMLTERRLEDFRELEHVETVYPVLSVSARLSYGRYDGYWEITGIPQEYLQELPLREGVCPEADSYRPALLIGNHVLDMFYNPSTMQSYTEFYGEDAELNGELMRVSFDMAEEESVHRLKVTGMIKGDSFRDSYRIYCDMDSLKRYLKQVTTTGILPGQPVNQNGEAYNEWIYSSAVIKVDDIDSVDTVLKKLQNMGYQTENDKEYVDSVQKTVKIVQLLLGGIGMIALIVAVIGIGNTMTTAVYDRIHEIGILKVLGCAPEELLYLFLLESGILGGLGGLIGILTSYGIIELLVNQLAVKLMKLPKGTELGVIPLWLAGAALIFAILLGILAGFFPAKWAAGMKPIQAVQR